MKKRNGMLQARPVTRSLLMMIVIAVGLVLTGCGEETARIEEQQIQLQVMAKTNAQHIKALAEVIEQNHQELKSGFETLQKDIQSVDARAIAFGEEQAKFHVEQVKFHQEQVKLQEIFQSNTRQLMSKMAAIEQNHDDLLTGMEAVQNDAENVVANMTSVADEQAKLNAGMTAITDEQARLYQTIQSNRQQLADTSTAIEQNRQEWQTTMGGLQENIQQVANNMNTLSSDLLKLQDILQGNIRELVSMVDASGQGQLDFQEKTRTGLKALDDSISSIKEGQNKLQSQIDEVQRSTEAINRDIPAVIEQLTNEISNMRETEAFIETEPFVSTDSDGIE